MSNESFSSMSMRRIRMKYHAKRALPGSWMRAMALVLISVLVGTLLVKLIPLQFSISWPTPTDQNYETLPLLILQSIVTSLHTFIQSITQNQLLLCGAILVLCWLISSPLSIGVAHFHLGVARLQKPKLTAALSVFTDLGTVARSMGLTLWLSILRLFWAMIFFAIPFFVFYIAFTTSFPLLAILGDQFFLGAFVLYFIKTLSYAPAVILFADDPSLGIFGAVKKSKAIMRGRLKEFFLFELSFFPSACSQRSRGFWATSSFSHITTPHWLCLWTRFAHGAIRIGFPRSPRTHKKKQRTM